MSFKDESAKGIKNGKPLQEKASMKMFILVP